MSDTALTTAPIGSGSDASLVEAGARRLAALSTAAPATRDPQATPEAPATTAAEAQSAPPPDQDTGDQPTLEQAEPGDPSAEQPSPEPADLDRLAFSLDDGTPVTVGEARKGYLRQQDYSAKQDMLARGRDYLVKTIEDTNASREALAKLIETYLPQVDPQLEYEDETRWVAQTIRRDKVLQQIARLRAESQVDRERIDAAAAEDTNAVMQRVLPHWGDEEVARKEQKIARDYVAALGWPEASIERARRDPYVIAAVLEAAKHRAVVKGAAKGGAATAAARLQPSPSIAQAQVRPAPVGTHAQRQQQASRSGEAVRTPTRPGSWRTREEQGAARLRPLAR